MRTPTAKVSPEVGGNQTVPPVLAQALMAFWIAVESSVAPSPLAPQARTSYQGLGPENAVPVGLTMLRGLTEARSEEHTSELQSRGHLVCRLLLEKKKNIRMNIR